MAQVSVVDHCGDSSFAYVIYRLHFIKRAISMEPIQVDLSNGEKVEVMKRFIDDYQRQLHEIEAELKPCSRRNKKPNSCTNTSGINQR